MLNSHQSTPNATDYMALPFHGETQRLIVQALHVSFAVCHRGHHGNKVGAVGHQRNTLVVETQAYLRGTSGGEDAVRGHHLSVYDSFGKEP